MGKVQSTTGGRRRWDGEVVKVGPLEKRRGTCPGKFQPKSGGFSGTGKHNQTARDSRQGRAKLLVLGIGGVNK